MDFRHVPGAEPAYSAAELGRGADGVVIEVSDHPANKRTARASKRPPTCPFNSRSTR